MSNASDFIIKNGVLNGYVGDGGNVVIPDGVKKIGFMAFSPRYDRWNGGNNNVAGCEQLLSIVIPDSVKEIGGSAFYGCINLSSVTISGSAVKMGAGVFTGCSNLADGNGLVIVQNILFECVSSETSIVLPQGVQKIGEKAFQNMKSLWNIELPQTVTEIGELAFDGCSNLTEVVLPESVVKIGSDAFINCRNLKRVVCRGVLPKIKKQLSGGIRMEYPDMVLAVTGPLPVPAANTVEISNATDFAYIWAFQTKKNWLDRMKAISSDPACIIPVFTEIAIKEEITEQQIDRMAEYIDLHAYQITPENIDNLIAAIETKNKDAAKYLQNSQAIKAIRNAAAATDCRQRCSMLENLCINISWSDETKRGIKKSVEFADDSGWAPIEAGMYLVEAYYEVMKKTIRSIPGEFNQIEMLIRGDGRLLTFCDAADQIAAELNRERLTELLAGQVYGNKYRHYILAFTRFASESGVEAFVLEIKKRRRGRAKDVYWAHTATEALFLSDTRAAVLFLEGEDRLGEYAAMRGKSRQDILDKFTLPDFDLDADGAKRFDTGSTTIAVSVDANLQLKLFDEGKKKEIKSFPKKSDDMEKLSAAAEAFKVYKKQVKELFDARIAILRENYISGTLISAEAWDRYYLKHPMLKLLTGMVIWQDQTGKQFMIENTTATALDGTVCVPEGAVTPAHPLDMCADEISAWQKRLIEKNCTLLMEQVWEPILDLNETELQKRYDGNYVSDTARKEMRRRLKSKGIDVQSVVEEDEFDYRNNSYRFTDNGTMIFDKYYRIEYQIQKEQQRIELGHGEVWQQTPKALNAIVFALDVATVESAIEADASERVTEDILNTYTAAQIRSFVELASKKHSTNCAAILLDYQNRHLGDFHPMDEFTLD